MKILISSAEEDGSRTVAGLVTMLQFGGAETGKGVAFRILDMANGSHQGYFPYGIDDPLSFSFAFVLMTAITNGYPVEAFYPDDNAEICTSVRVLSPV